MCNVLWTTYDYFEPGHYKIKLENRSVHFFSGSSSLPNDIVYANRSTLLKDVNTFALFSGLQNQSKSVVSFWNGYGSQTQMKPFNEASPVTYLYLRMHWLWGLTKKSLKAPKPSATVYNALQIITRNSTIRNISNIKKRLLRFLSTLEKFWYFS